jgi:hypothetical protein
MKHSWMTNLSPELFWDVRRAEVSPEENMPWLVQRILTYGRWEDWVLLLSHTTRDELRQVAGRLKIPLRERIFLDNYLEGLK